MSFGPGHWGNGTPVLNATGTGFRGSGEVHGVIRLLGTFSAITFSDTSEDWHGLTVGVLGLADVSPVPLPAPLALFGLGLLAMGLARRRAR